MSAARRLRLKPMVGGGQISGELSPRTGRPHSHAKIPGFSKQKTQFSIYDEAGVVGGRGRLSNRGDKTTWNAENQRHAVKIADSQELLKVINVGDWNDVTLVAKANHITYSINGRVMTELIDESPNAAREGVLALQLHEGFTMDVQFKDGKVRKLD
jgi:hypothetical protein